MPNQTQTKTQPSQTVQPRQHSRMFAFLAVMVVLVIIAVVVWASRSSAPEPSVTVSVPRTALPSNPQVDPVTPEPEPNVVLSLTQLTPSVPTGGAFEIGVEIEAGDALVDGVDVVLSYDLAHLEYVPKSLKAGTVLPQLVGAQADAKTGKLTFSLLSQPGQPAMIETARIATLSFRIKKAGETEIKLLSVPGSSTDTNVASKGNDVLGRVANLVLLAP